MLHLIFSLAGFQRAKKHVDDGDRMVFLEDGCYIAQNLPGLRSYVIENHAKSREVDIPSELGSCTMADLVSMIVECEKSISWK